MKQKRVMPSPEMLEYLGENFRYDPETGDILRVVFSTDNSGYKRVNGSIGSRVDKVKYSFAAHHVAWFLMTGEWPPVGMQIDHRNRKRGDNRWDNLRLVTPSQNSANRRAWGEVKKRGVTIVRQGNYVRYKATIGTWPDVKMLGLFKTEDEAYEAYVAAAIEKYGEYASVHHED
jgi:hypothetical protein